MNKTISIIGIILLGFWIMKGSYFISLLSRNDLLVSSLFIADLLYRYKIIIMNILALIIGLFAGYGILNLFKIK